MKHPTNTPFPVQYAQLPVYVLAVLLATFIAALHAGILFDLADLLQVLRGWAKAVAVAADRPADILVVVAAICALFTAHIGYFAGTSHTTLGYGDLVLKKPWRSLGPIPAINGLLTYGCSTAYLFLVLQNIWQHPL